MTEDEMRLAKIFSKPVTSIENAGWVLGMGKNKAHGAAKIGDIPTVAGVKRSVPCPWLKQQLDGKR